MDMEEKKAFFDDLYQLDDESDGLEEKSTASAVLAQSRLPTSRKGKERALDGLHSYQSLGRTVSTPIGRGAMSFPGSSVPCQVTHNAAKSSNFETLENQAISEFTQQTLRHSVGMSTKVGKKRKRGQSFDALPDSQQIFKGLSFFFFPNNDVAPARAFRIRKALEWGALWIKTWKEGITHVVVDKNLSIKDLLTFLKIQSLPQDIIVVNEDYPADCIRFRFVVNPRQSHYQVQGYEEPKRPPNVQPSSSDLSLQLRPEKEEIGRLLQTPSRSDGSAGLVHVSSNSKPDPDPDVTHVSDSMPSSNGEYSRDALSEAIEEAQAIQGLPIDLDEDEAVSKDILPDDSDGEYSDEGNRSENRLKDSFAETWQQRFTCMTKHDGAGNPENPNIRTIEVLQQMTDYYERTKDHWRTTAYRKAISALKTQTRKITTAEEAFAIPFVGKRLADKIEEIVCTDRLRRLDNTKQDANDEVLQRFLKIYSVGYVQANRWVEQGHRNIDDLLSKVGLTKNQRIGIEHLEDFQSRIPRKEMDQHNEFVCETISKIDPSLQFTIGGSYRRGAQDCGDIDFIVTKHRCPIELLRTIMLGTVIPHLFKKGYLRAGLATTKRDDGSKWHGASALPGNNVWRRIDFLFVPWDELGAALIYFTGNDIFNRSIRLLASKKGMRLNQHGLWKDVIRGRDRARLTQGSLVEGRDEKKIFELLGVPWRPPEHRIC